MELETQVIDERTSLLFEMLEASHGLLYWVYDSQGKTLKTNSKGIALDEILSQGTGKRDMLEHGVQEATPMLLSLPMGLIWVVAFERHEGVLHRVFVLGPAFHTEISMRGIIKAIDQYQIPQGWKLGFMELIQSLPVLSMPSLRRVAVMLHHCVTGERISPIDIHAKQTLSDLVKETSASPTKDRYRTYMAEQRLLDNVRQGNLNYQSAFAEASSLSSGVQVKTDTAIAHVKTSQIAFITLCVRAAIEGGLTPDVAYSTGDAYIQLVNDSEDLMRVGEIGRTMYQSFIQMVHDAKARTNLSKPIRSCCEYIDLHLEDVLSLEILSQRFGYTVNYLSNRFSQEVGISPTAYISRARIERACYLLRNSTDTIPEISQRLHFCNRGYFSTVFKEQMGLTPVQYRKQHQAK